MTIENINSLPTSVVEFINSIRQDPNVKWGGEFGDPIHIDDRLNVSNSRKWKEHFNECLEDFSSAKLKWKIWK